MNTIVKTEPEMHAEIMENVLIRGDIAKLTVQERGKYYFELCNSLGLNALTQPFEYIQLNGKLKLYAKKDCTDQLRFVHGVSVTDLLESERDGVFIVKAKVCNAKGRTDVSTGAVNIKGLQGEALANAMMKSETKAKRRATLSICGLGMLDETEIEDIPASAKGQVPRDAAPPRRVEAVVSQIEPPKEVAAPTAKPTSEAAKPENEPHKIVGGTYASWATSYIEAMGTAGDTATVFAWIDANRQQLDKLAKGSASDMARVKTASDKHLTFLRKTEPKADPITSGPQGSLLGDMGGDSAPKAGKPRGRPPKGGKEPPDFDKDYDGWIKFYLSAVAAAKSGDEIEALFDKIDERWVNLMPPDKDSLQAARREAEQRLEI